MPSGWATEIMCRSEPAGGRDILVPGDVAARLFRNSGAQADFVAKEGGVRRVQVDGVPKGIACCDETKPDGTARESIARR